MVTISPAVARILSGVTPHARLHAICLLVAVPGLTVSSGRRTPERNRAVGGVPGSFHLRGRAVDFSGSRANLARGATVAKCQRVTCGCTGPEEVLVHDSGSGLHLHVAW